MKLLQRMAWWQPILWVDLYLVIVAGILKYTGSNYPILKYFNLASESNLAVWWSVTTLFLAALLMLEEAFQKQLNRFAWISVAVLLAALSLDEFGSIHERVLNSDFSNAYPYAIAGVLLLTYALVRLYRSPETRKSSILILMGFACFGSIAFQEFFEHAIIWPYWSIGPRVMIEEGTELVGTFLCLAAIVRLRKPSLPGFSLTLLLPQKALPLQSRLIFFAVGLIVHTNAVIWAQTLDDLHAKGNPSLWLPSMVSYMVFLYGLRRLFQTNNFRVLGPLCMSFLGFSAFYGCFDFSQSFGWQDIAILMLVNIAQAVILLGVILLPKNLTSSTLWQSEDTRVLS